MSFVSGKTYRFINNYYDTHALNVYGTNAASTGRNVCLFKDDDTDVMQDWVVKTSGNGYRLHSAVNQTFVLDCSDGSLSNSYKNNAHLCATSQTSTTDSQVKFEKVTDNVYKIYLPGKNLYLTATNTNTPVSSSIGNNTALTGGTGGNSNIYWAPKSTSTKQQWIVSPDVDGGSTTDPEPNPGKQIIVTNMPSGIYHGNTEYFHPQSGMKNGTWSQNNGAEKENAVKSFYKKVFKASSTPNAQCLYNLFGAAYSEGTGYEGQYHSGIDMYVSGGSKIYSAHTGVVTAVGGTYGLVAIYDENKKVTYLYLHMNTSGTDAIVGKTIHEGDFLGMQSNVGLVGSGNQHLHIEVREGRKTTPATLPTIDTPLTSISPYNYL